MNKAHYVITSPFAAKASKFSPKFCTAGPILMTFLSKSVVSISDGLKKHLADIFEKYAKIQI